MIATVGRRDDVANFKLEMFKLPVEKKDLKLRKGPESKIVM